MDYGAVHQASKALPRLKPRQFLRHINEIYKLNTIVMFEVNYYLIRKCQPVQELISNDEERRLVSAALEIMKSECTVEGTLSLPPPCPVYSFDRLVARLTCFLIPVA